MCICSIQVWNKQEDILSGLTIICSRIVGKKRVKTFNDELHLSTKQTHLRTIDMQFKLPKEELKVISINTVISDLALLGIWRGESLDEAMTSIRSVQPSASGKFPYSNCNL